ELYEVNIKGTANMINFSILNGVERFLYMSSIAVMDSINNEVITEKSSFLDKKFHSKYACSKFEGEMEVWRGSQEELNVVIVNAGVVLGGGFWDQSSGEVFKKSLKGYYTSGGSAFVFVKDLAKCSVKLMNKGCFRERFIVISENISYKKLVKKICSFKNNRTKFISNTQLKWLRTFASWGALLGFENILSQATYESLISRTHYDNSKVKKTLDYEFEEIDKVLPSILKEYEI
ncbi:MAG: NAD-dependent epimerase/dehydratase family protein, partial [Flavobacteriales bacterium]